MPHSHTRAFDKYHLLEFSRLLTFMRPIWCVYLVHRAKYNLHSRVRLCRLGCNSRTVRQDRGTLAYAKDQFKFMVNRTRVLLLSPALDCGI